MSTGTVPKKAWSSKRGFTSTEEKILSAFGELQVPYFTAEDMTRLRFQKGSKAFVRRVMTELAGGGDNINHYLLRFGLPYAPGNFERYFALGSRGRDYLRTLGLDMHWWQRRRNYSFNTLLHDSFVIKALVALHLFVGQYPDYQLVETKTAFALAKNPPRFTFSPSEAVQETINVIPDIWACLERAHGDTPEVFAMWIEVDCGTETREKFQRLLINRINLIRTKKYAEFFNIHSITFCYLVGTPTRDQRLVRLRRLREWTADVLAEMSLDDWSPLFRFSTIDEYLYDSLILFTDPVFCTPDSDTLISLFSTPQL